MDNKNNIKHNMLILYITSMLIGLELGLRDFSTTLQVLFEKVGGEKLLLLINQFSFYSFLLCILLIGVNVSKYKLKNKIAFMEFITFFGYFVIAILLKLNMLTGWILFFIVFGNMIINRVLIVFWISFKMKIVSSEQFKKLLGNAIFFQMIAIMAGMSFSYLIIGKPYPQNFIELFFIVAIVGFAVCILYTLLKEPEYVETKAESQNISLKEIIKHTNEKNYFNMMLSKILFNLSFGVVVLFAFYAIRLGYSEQDIVLMGLCSYVFQALSALLFGNIKLTNKKVIYFAHIFTILSIISVFVLQNLFLGFILLGISEPLVHIGYYGFINSLEGKKKHIYLTSETVISFISGLSVAMFGFIMRHYGYTISTVLSIILILLATIYTNRLEEEENGKVNTNDATIP